MKFIPFYTFALLFLLTLSCEDPSDVGEGIIPDADVLPLDSISFNDIILNNYRDDSILFSNISFARIGKFNSDVFGTSNASFATEVYYNNTFNRLDNATFDSLVLYLNIAGFVGDSTVTQSFNIYEMADSLKATTDSNPDEYYIYETVGKGQLLGQLNDVVYRSDSTYVDTTLTSAHLKTHLSHSFGEALFNELNDSTITNAEELQDYFKGLYIEPTTTSGGDGWFNITVVPSSPAFTGLYFYYHNDDESARQQIRFPVLTDGLFTSNDTTYYYPGAQNINPTINTYATAEDGLKNNIDNPTATGTEVGYLQGGNGTYLELDFSNLLSLFEPNTTINEAELTFKPILENLADTSYLPLGLILAEEFEVDDSGELTGGLYGIDGSGRVSTEENSNRFDRTTTATRIRNDVGDYEYTFYLPRTTQSIKDGIIEEPKLYLFVNTRTQSVNGFKFNKSDIDFKILYTKID